MPPTEWPPKMTARMIEFYEDGRGYAEIARILSKQFKRPVTDDSVRCKLRRLADRGVRVERIAP